MSSLRPRRPSLSNQDPIPINYSGLMQAFRSGGFRGPDHEHADATQPPHRAEAGACPATLMLLSTHGRALAQEATPGALPADSSSSPKIPMPSPTSGYISLFIVTDDGVIATDPSSQGGPERAEAYREAITSVTDQPVRYLIYSHDHADHATGGEVFADTATFISHRIAVEKLAALNDPSTPVPEIAFNDELTIELGGKTIELYYTGRNHSDNSIVLLYPERRLLFAVDFIPVNALPYQNLPDAYPEEWVESLRWIEETSTSNPGARASATAGNEGKRDRGTRVSGGPDGRGARRPGPGTGGKLPEMIEAVRTELEPHLRHLGHVRRVAPAQYRGSPPYLGGNRRNGSDAGALTAGNRYDKRKRWGLGRQIERGFATLGVERD